MSNSSSNQPSTKEEFLQELEGFIEVDVVNLDDFHLSLARLYLMLYYEGSIQKKIKLLSLSDNDPFIFIGVKILKQDYMRLFMNYDLIKPFNEMLKKQVRRIQDHASIYNKICNLNPEFENTEFAEPIYNLLNYDEQETIINRELKRKRWNYTLKFSHSQNEEQLQEHQNDLKQFYHFVMELHYIHEHRIALNYSKWNYRSLTILDIDLLPKLSIQELQIPSISHNENKDELYFSGDKQILYYMNEMFLEIQSNPAKKRFLFLRSILREADLYDNYKDELTEKFLPQVEIFEAKFKTGSLKETHLIPT
ncbi:hypothetical protein GO495_06595 [Chitinophaga oryziterrae]|uniref:Uncharacterized protein n=1 Tax=Chitinophaga oryziterrae TaxID=1031224 RepID=A0A6N8J5C6_9BACT|nr:hypothetical protein [Chitinophaga oryziterrae]MVT40243.1 hypothetical protein [Chitinophaga oryziterrae]